MSQLNPQQHAAVRHIDGPLLVLAGAGSGKTRVITQKISYLIQECNLSARHIVAVTFTNKAAREMKARIAKMLTSQQTRGLLVATFHNLGLTIIRQELELLGLKSGFTVFDDQDSHVLLRELMHKDHSDNQEIIAQIQSRISHWKNNLIDPAQALILAKTDQEIIAANIYTNYDRHLRAYNAVDFDDLILLPTKLFQTHPHVLEKWQNKIRYLLVDEYQDTNASQYSLVKLLVGVRAAFTVVGDDDQSIYAWRGAKPENLLQLQQDFPQLKIIKLEQNYRSMGRILRVANHLIANNPHVFVKNLWSDLGIGDPLRIICAQDDEQEAERVVTEIISHRFKHQTQYRDYAILYRGNHQSRIFEKVLRAYHVPYYLSGGTSFFARTEIKDVMAYLRLLINPDDDNALLRIINVPRRGIGPSTLEALGNYATQRHISLLHACFEVGLQQHLAPAAIEKLTHFANWIVLTADNAVRGDTIGVIKDLVRTIDYESWLFENSSNPRQAEKRMENVNELINWLQRLLENNEEEERSLKEVVAKLVLLDMLDQQESEDKRDQVQLLTLHAAKGLEFPHVFLVGMEEELLPHRTSIEEENIEEERRLAYVGITRAQLSLTFTLAKQRKRFGERIDCEPSRFLKELPSEDLNWEGHQPQVDPEQRQQHGKSQLASLRGLLNDPVT